MHTVTVNPTSLYLIEGLIEIWKLLFYFFIQGLCSKNGGRPAWAHVLHPAFHQPVRKSNWRQRWVSPMTPQSGVSMVAEWVQFPPSWPELPVSLFVFFCDISFLLCLTVVCAAQGKWITCSMSSVSSTQTSFQLQPCLSRVRQNMNQLCKMYFVWSLWLLTIKIYTAEDVPMCPRK